MIMLLLQTLIVTFVQFLVISPVILFIFWPQIEAGLKRRKENLTRIEEACVGYQELIKNFSNEPEFHETFTKNYKDANLIFAKLIRFHRVPQSEINIVLSAYHFDKNISQVYANLPSNINQEVEGIRYAGEVYPTEKTTNKITIAQMLLAMFRIFPELEGQNVKFTIQNIEGKNMLFPYVKATTKA